MNLKFQFKIKLEMSFYCSVKETLSLFYQEVVKMVGETLYLNFNGLGLVGDTELYMHVQNDRNMKTLKKVAGRYVYFLPILEICNASKNAF